MKTAKNSKAISAKKKQTTPEVISYRKSCDVQGTGLTHYILMGNKAK